MKQYRYRIVLSVFVSMLWLLPLQHVSAARGQHVLHKQQLLEEVKAARVIAKQRLQQVAHDHDKQDRAMKKQQEITALIATYEQVSDAADDLNELEEYQESFLKRIELKTSAGESRYERFEQFIKVPGSPTRRNQAKAAVKQALKKHQTYNVVIRSDRSLSEVRQALQPYDRMIEITPLFPAKQEHYYRVTTSVESLLGEELLNEIEQEALPEALLGFTIIDPEVLEVTQSLLLDGEDISSLRGLQRYQAQAYQEALHSGAEVTVGIVDTGIDMTHPDLADRLSQSIAGYDFLHDDADPTDDHYHGTHVAGTIAAAVNGHGIFGVNSHASLVPLKICNSQGFCPTYAIYDAVVYAAEQGVDVLNMSLGGAVDPQTSPVCDAIDFATQQGVLVVAAAGNGDTNADTYIPGGCDQTITVGAVDAQGHRAGFSNYGDAVDVAAPGVGIVSTEPGGGYRALDGTSMAAPHIAGIVSAVLSRQGPQSFEQIMSILRDATTSVTHESGKSVGGFVEFTQVMQALGIQPSQQLCGGQENRQQGRCSGGEGGGVGIADVSQEQIEYITIGNNGDAAALQTSEQVLEVTVGEVAYIHVTGGAERVTVQNLTPDLGLGRPPASDVIIADDQGRIEIESDGVVGSSQEFGNEIYTDQPELPTEEVSMLSLGGEQANGTTIQNADPARTFAIRGNTTGTHEFTVLDTLGNRIHLPVHVKEKVLHVNPVSIYYFSHTDQYRVTGVFIPNEVSRLNARRCKYSYCGGYPYNTYGFKVYADGVAHIKVRVYNIAEQYEQFMDVTVVAGNALYENATMSSPPDGHDMSQLWTNFKNAEMTIGEMLPIYLAGGSAGHSISYSCDELFLGHPDGGSLGVMSNGSHENVEINYTGKRKRSVNATLRDHLPPKEILKKIGKKRADFTEIQTASIHDIVSKKTRDRLINGSVQLGGGVKEGISIATAEPGVLGTYAIGLIDGVCSLTVRDGSNQRKQVRIKVLKDNWQFKQGDTYRLVPQSRFSIQEAASYNSSVVGVASLGDGTYLLDAKAPGSAFLRLKVLPTGGTLRYAWAYAQVHAGGEVTMMPILTDKAGMEAANRQLQITHEQLVAYAGEKATLHLVGGVPPFTVLRGSEHVGLVENMASVTQQAVDALGPMQALSDFTERDAKEIELVGLQPGSSTITVVDSRGQQTVVDILVKERSFLLQPETTYLFDPGIRYQVSDINSGNPDMMDLHYNQLAGAYQLDAKATGSTTLDVGFHNFFEGTGQALRYAIDIEHPSMVQDPVDEEELPPLHLNHTQLHLQAGETVTIQVAGGTPTYTVEANDIVGFAHVDHFLGEDVSLANASQGVVFVTEETTNIGTGAEQDPEEVYVLSPVATGTSNGWTVALTDSITDSPIDNEVVQTSSRYFRVIGLKPGTTTIHVRDELGRVGEIDVTVSDRELVLTVGQSLLLEDLDRYRITRVRTGNRTLLGVKNLGNGRFEIDPKIHGETSLTVYIYNEHQQRDQKIVYPIAIVNEGGNDAFQQLADPIIEDPVSDSVSATFERDDSGLRGSIRMHLSGAPDGNYAVTLEDEGVILIPPDEATIASETPYGFCKVEVTQKGTTKTFQAQCEDGEVFMDMITIQSRDLQVGVGDVKYDVAYTQDLPPTGEPQRRLLRLPLGYQESVTYNANLSIQSHVGIENEPASLDVLDVDHTGNTISLTAQQLGRTYLRLSVLNAVTEELTLLTLDVYIVEDASQIEPDMTDDFVEKLIEAGEVMEGKVQLEQDALQYNGTPAYMIEVGKKYGFFYDQVRPSGPRDYKNIPHSVIYALSGQKIFGGYQGMSHMYIGGERVAVDVPGNMSFGFSAMAGVIPYTLQFNGSIVAQVIVDLADDGLSNFDLIRLVLNEYGDNEWIARGALLYLKYGTHIDNNKLTSYISRPVSELLEENEISYALDEWFFELYP